MDRITIGDVADAVGVSAKSIRLWEEKGLIPDVERTPAGYRLYEERHVAALRFVHQAKRLGMTLADIRRILDLQQAGSDPCERVTRMLDDRIDEIDRAMITLDHFRTTLLDARQRADVRMDRNGSGPSLCPIIERSGDPCP